MKIFKNNQSYSAGESNNNSKNGKLLFPVNEDYSMNGNVKHPGFTKREEVSRCTEKAEKRMTEICECLGFCPALEMVSATYN